MSNNNNFDATIIDLAESMGVEYGDVLVSFDADYLGMVEVTEDECADYVVEDEELARLVLEESMKEEPDEIDEIPGHVSPDLHWYDDGMRDRLAYVIECQNAMGKIMAKIEDAQAGNYIPKNKYQGLWNTWKRGKDTCKDVIGQDKYIWRKYFQMAEDEELDSYLKEYLSDEITRYNTTGIDEEQEEGDTRHAPSDVVFAYSHLEEMAEYNRSVHVDWSFQDKRMANRNANEKSQIEWYTNTRLVQAYGKDIEVSQEEHKSYQLMVDEMVSNSNPF